jgi:hypothetical protein
LQNLVKNDSGTSRSKAGNGTASQEDANFWLLN